MRCPRYSTPLHAPLPNASGSVRADHLSGRHVTHCRRLRLLSSYFTSAARAVERSRKSTAVMQSCQLGVFAERLRRIAKRSYGLPRSEANKWSFQRTFSTEFCDRRVAVRHSGRHRRPLCFEDRTTTSMSPPVNRVGRSVDASSAPPAAFQQVVPTPMRGTERYAYPDFRPNEATKCVNVPVRCDY